MTCLRPTSDLDEPMQELGDSEILQTFRGSHVFIIGADGFLGQVLVEKLLRTCEVDKLYLLMKAEEDKTEQECLENFFVGKLFERLMREQPMCMGKVDLIPGDCEKQGLGLSERDRNLLLNHVNFLFNFNSKGHFCDSIWTAVNANIRTTKVMLDIAKEFSNLKAFVHVSTAFAHCYQKEIDEKFYRTRFQWHELIHLVDSLDHSTLQNITPILIGNWPNAYLFTKAVSEDLIQDEGVNLPIAILRPSVVVNTLHEPVMGWTNDISGAAGVVAGAAEGLLKSLHCEKEKLADMVPADMCVNASITIAWELEKKEFQQYNPTENIPIFNLVSTTQNPITWEIFKHFNESAINYPFSLSNWYYSLTLNKHRSVHNIYIFFLHLLPALLMDMGARVLGKEPVMWRAYMKIHSYMDAISYFTTQEWKFHNTNIQRLWKKLNPKDRKLFNFDVTSIDWEVYLSYMLKGLKYYFGDEGIDKLDQFTTQYKRLQYLHNSVAYSVRLVILYVLYHICLRVEQLLGCSEASIRDYIPF